MEQQLLLGTALFAGMTPEEMETLLDCLGPRRVCFDREARILHVGQKASELGVVLEGRVLIQNDDAWGNTTVLDSVGPGQIFAETYACAGTPMLVDVVAAEPTAVLFLQVGRVLGSCSRGCACHARLVANLLQLSAQKNLTLSRKIFHTSAKSIRGRLLSYLSDCAAKAGDSRFAIPFNRQQLADYLNVDRSALSNELGKMQREGLLRTERNRFELLNTAQEWNT